LPAMPVAASPARMAPGSVSVPMRAMRFSAPAPQGGEALERGGFWASAKRAVFGEARSEPVVSAPVPSPSYDGAWAGSPPPDPLYDVLMTQGASGTFELVPAVEEWLGGERTARIRAASVHADPAVVVTAVVVALLERDHRDREAEWRPAVAKAKAWLGRQKAFDASVML
jgi:hypothetical protein